MGPAQMKVKDDPLNYVKPAEGLGCIPKYLM